MAGESHIRLCYIGLEGMGFAEIKMAEHKFASGLPRITKNLSNRFDFLLFLVILFFQQACKKSFWRNKMWIYF
jgi:hypothetical protein